MFLVYMYLCSFIYYCSFSFFFFKQKTAYEMRISDWSSDVCSSDLEIAYHRHLVGDEDDGEAELAVDVAEQRQDLPRRLRIERRGRLVAEQDGGLRRQRAGDADALLLPAG